jgi:hypothetical protein
MIITMMTLKGSFATMMTLKVSHDLEGFKKLESSSNKIASSNLLGCWSFLYTQKTHSQVVDLHLVQ